MKKIILTALAVLMVLAFAGCSGDLHDKGLLDGGWYVAGSFCDPEWNPKACPVVGVSSTEWYFDFTANAADGGFQICPGTWDGTYGGATITAGGAPAAMEIGGGDASISGLTVDSKYRITFKQNPEDFKLYASVKAL